MELYNRTILNRGTYFYAGPKTLGGLSLYEKDDVLDRETTLRLWTQGSVWFSGEADVKGTLSPNQYADLAVLSADYMSVPAEEIRQINSVLTVMGGQVVYGEGDYSDLSPPLPPAAPDWSPVNAEPSPASRPVAASVAASGVAARACHEGCDNACAVHRHDHQIAWNRPLPVADRRSFWGALDCSCFAV